MQIAGVILAHSNNASLQFKLAELQVLRTPTIQMKGIERHHLTNRKHRETETETGNCFRG